jgi:hypothetical protein
MQYHLIDGMEIPSMIYLIAKYPKLSVGHYWSFDGYVRKALREFGIPYTFINPSADCAKIEDGQPSAVKYRYANIKNDSNFINSITEFINKDSSKRNFDRIVIFIPWLPQITETDLAQLSLLEKERHVDYVGLTVSTSDAVQGIKKTNCRFQYEEFFASKANSLLWVADHIPDDYETRTNIRELPDYADVSYPKSSPKSVDLGFYGLLTPYRGLFEILVIAAFNPKLNIKIKGYGFSKHRVVRPWKLKFLRYGTWRRNPAASIIFGAASLILGLLRFLPNIDFSDKPFDDEKALDAAIGNTKAIFYCPKLVHSSGLTNKAIAGGIPVLWNGWEGKAFNRLLESYSFGFFKYKEIFIPNRISAKVQKLPTLQPQHDLMWKKFSMEISRIRNLAE